MDRWSLFIYAFLTLVGIITYSSTGQDEAILFFIFALIIALSTLPRLFDFLKDVREGKKEKSTGDNQMLQARLENLESLMCRLDSEIQQQLEKSLSAGKIVTVEGNAVSQMPTTFLNVVSALENRYQILKELGRGGMGIVFQAHDKQLKEQVAIKILSPLLNQDTDALERLKREVSSARKISHPNVIRIFDISEMNGLNFVSMEYFPGVNLKTYIRQSGTLSFQEAGSIAFQICDGLDAAHRQGVIHRDLKSQNIIVNATGEIKMIDFGLAMSSQLQGLTATGLIMGTPEYMAPEQVSGKRVDHRADIYSAGIILYELFTGKVPFHGDSAIAIGFKQMKESPVPPREINEQLPEEIERIILKALRKDPVQRYISVAELKSDLERAIFASDKALLEQRRPAQREEARVKS